MSESRPVAQRRLFRHPAQAIGTLFASGVTIGTAVLMLPISRAGPGAADFMDALFTATSAVTVTGLNTVDLPTYWSGFGEAAILVMFQVGGFGIMTSGSLLALLVARRLGLRNRVNAAGESNTIQMGDVRGVMLGLMKITLVVESIVALVLAIRFFTKYDESFWRSAYLGVWHSISAFNNAGFTLFSNSLMSFVSDPWICMPINVAVILGSVGFPVLFELRKRIGPRLWSLHAKLTLIGSAALLVTGFLLFTSLEWNNPATLGALDTPSRLMAGFTGSVQPRSAGFSSVDYGQLGEPTLFVTTLLMFIGGGSASAAGGIKVTTFFLLLYVIVAEVRGARDVEIAERRIDTRTQRQALSVALVFTGLVVAATLILMTIEPVGLNRALFEVVSAFATAGLSTGLTANLGVAGQLMLMVLMFLGRVGPVTLVSALALRERQHFYRYPEGRPLIG